MVPRGGQTVVQLHNRPQMRAKGTVGESRELPQAKPGRWLERTYRHPRTGEKRQQLHPLRIDRLGRGVKDVITSGRAAGETCGRVAVMASAAAGQRLSRTSVQRWYDLRIEQRSPSAALREIISLLKSILSAVQP